MRRLRILLLAGVAAGALMVEIERADAQSNPGWQQGKVPTTAEWAAAWSSKLDFPLPLPSCGALQWVQGVGVQCNSALAASAGVASTLNVVIDGSTNSLLPILFVNGTVGGNTTPIETFPGALGFNPASQQLYANFAQTGFSHSFGNAFNAGAFVSIAGATASKAPIQMLATGTLMTTPSSGAVEFDGNALYGTSLAGNRAVIVAENLCMGSTDFTLTNGTAAQQALACSANGQLTIAAVTYAFEASYRITSTGTVSHTWALQFGGGATYAIGYDALSATSAGTALGSTNALFSSLSAATVITPASTLSNEQTVIKINGFLRASIGGTFQPQLKLSAAPGAAPVMKAGSFFRLWPVGAQNVSTVGNWN